MNFWDEPGREVHDVLDSEAPDGAPTGGLEMEVDRLATEKTGSCIIVQRPDRRLANLLHDFTRR